MKTTDAAAGKWKDILPRFDIDRNVLNGRHHRCPCTGKGDDRFRFSDQNGSGNYFCECSQDGKGGGIKLLMCKTGKSFAQVASEVDDIIGNKPDSTEKPDRKDPLPVLREIQSRAKPAGESVRSYLEGRGLIVPPTVRQVDNYEYWDGGNIVAKRDAMVCRIVNVKGEPESWHVTWLDGGKCANLNPSRKVMTAKNTVSGGAIRLFPQADQIGVAEGVETAIAAHMLFAMPVWSVMSEGCMAKFEAPAGVKSVIYFGDNDKNFVGQAAAYAGAKRTAAKGLDTRVSIPQDIGDWNDALREALK